MDYRAWTRISPCKFIGQSDCHKKCWGTEGIEAKEAELGLFYMSRYNGLRFENVYVLQND